MTITYCGEGDLLRTQMQTIVIPVNTVGVMGSGLACWFRNRYPKQYGIYRRHCLAGNFTLGSLLLFDIGDRKFLLLPTKKHWSKDSEIEYLELGLQKLVDTYKERGITSLSIPPLGSGKGNLNFDECVKPLLYKYLDSLDIPVEIVHL